MEHSLSRVLSLLWTSQGQIISSFWALNVSFIKLGKWYGLSFCKNALRPVHEKCCEVLVMLLDLRYSYILSTIQILYVFVCFCEVLWLSLMTSWYIPQPTGVHSWDIFFFSLVEVLISWKSRREGIQRKEEKHFALQLVEVIYVAVSVHFRTCFCAVSINNRKQEPM